MIEAPKDWSEFLSCMNARRVRYLVIGAHALAAAGRPRATLDLDLFVEPTEANAKRLGKALADFGFNALGDAAMAFAEGDRMATLGREPYRIDLLNKIAGVTFHVAWAGRQRGKLGGVRVNVLGKKQLITNKLATGRVKDRLDVALLREGDDDRALRGPRRRR